MTSYVTPKKNAAFILYIGLPSQANPAIFKDTPTLAAGDFKVSIDGGALANMTTLPTNTPGNQMVKCSFSSSEMNGDNITLVAHDAAGAEWSDVIVNIQTTARQVDDLAYPATSGRSMVVDANGLVDANMVKAGPTGSGTAITARDIGASVLLSAGTGTGQLDFTSGVVKANLAQILGTALTETAGQIAAGFKKLFDVASPVFTLLSVNQTGDSYARLGAPVGASHSADVAAVKTDTAAIKTKTDSLTFTVAGMADANVVDWKGATAPAMTGDAFARLGAPTGASVSADIAAVGAQTTASAIRADVGLASANLDTQLGTLATPAQVKTQVVAALNTDTYAEPGQGAPAATATLAAKIGYLYKAFRNKKTQTSTTFSLFADDATTVDQKATVSDDGTTFTSGEVATGP